MLSTPFPMLENTLRERVTRTPHSMPKIVTVSSVPHGHDGIHIAYAYMRSYDGMFLA